ncbi:MAG: YggS family pyridoxal phosphate-dependent enzyme [Balneolaceae bacterium]|nr:YggS family pyridoxal phosphate-dependent enzyme [Balneolaceae bacterium]
MNYSNIKGNLESIQNRINEAAMRANRDPKDIKLIAVSKTKPNEAILNALEAGQLHFGENRMQELQSKMDEIPNEQAQWHMIGTMQSNKIKYIAHRVNWIHSVGKAKYLNEIDKRAGQSDHHVNVLIQINISDEDQKSGCDIRDLERILEQARQYEHITVKGLMGMARFTNNPEEVRSEFALLKSAFDSHQYLNGGNIDLTELSMGMSNDFEVAIEEGATMVRIGSAIFGARN